MKETRGNLLEANVEAIVNAVNCVGVMGKGSALQFKQKFPADYFKTYKNACQNGGLRIGKVQVYSLDSEIKPRFIINFPTKNHWREKSRIEDIENGLESLIQSVKEYEIKSIAMPALGCGLGGLNYMDVKLLIENAFLSLPNVEVLLFLPK